MPAVLPSSPPAFAWDEWYAAAGGRTIRIEEVSSYLQKIYDDQYPRFDGPVATERHDFASPVEAAHLLKKKAIEFGADIVGICEIEASDSDLLHIPIGLKTGFGELGRHGSIIHPRLGPLFRMGSVATSIPLARAGVADKPHARQTTTVSDRGSV